MVNIDELRANIDTLEASACSIESSARDMYRLARLVDTAHGTPTPFASYEWIGPTDDAWKELQRDVTRRYQQWYSTALQYVRVYTPDRLNEFTRFYGYEPGRFHGFIEALNLGIDENNSNAAEKVDRYMSWFSRQRDLLHGIPSIAEAQEEGIETSDPIKSVCNLCERFHFIARQLRANRRGEREPLDIRDEYDVQYLFHALLQLHFNDVRPEEPTPSYAGSGTKMDFLLRPEQIVIETKMSREGLDARKLGNELIEDIAHYHAHPDCKTLICFVYDPMGLIANPRGVENDLNKLTEEPFVQVFIRPY
jgi:hypothetical protein